MSTKLNLKDVNNIIDLSEKGWTRQQICNIYNCDTETLRMFLIRNNIKLIKNQTLVKNQRFFDEINSELKAYLLGFIIADGCITIDKKPRLNGNIDIISTRLCFTISKIDEQILYLFRDNISPFSKIVYFLNTKGAKNRKEQCSLRISSSHLSSVLKNKYNIHPRKTHDINFKFPFENIPKEYYKDLIRGYFDGDGWCSNEQFGIVTTSKSFIEQILNILKEDLNLNQNISKYKTKNMIIYTLHFGKKDSKLIYDWMYNNSTYYFKRKKDKFNKENTEVTVNDSTVERSN